MNKYIFILSGLKSCKSFDTEAFNKTEEKFLIFLFLTAKMEFFLHLNNFKLINISLSI